LLIGLGTATWLFFMERAARREAVAAEELQYLLRQEAEEARANEAELRRQAEIREKITLADVRVNQNAPEEADNLLNGYAPTQSTLEGARVFRAVGEWHALQGRWPQAANRFGVLIQIDKFDGWDMASLDYLRLGPAILELGDVKGYENFRDGTIARFAGTSYPVAAERVVKISLLQPADPKTINALTPLAALAAKSFGNVAPGNTNAETVFQAAWGSLSLALMDYRQGNYSGAEDCCRRCLAYPGDNPPRVATARVILAMSCHQLGQNREAATQLALSRKTIETKFEDDLDPGTAEHGFWFDWVFARILLREATSLIETAPAAAQSSAQRVSG